jgi:hypothetical protein
LQAAASLSQSGDNRSLTEMQREEANRPVSTLCLIPNPMTTIIRKLETSGQF